MDGDRITPADHAKADALVSQALAKERDLKGSSGNKCSD